MRRLGWIFAALLVAGSAQAHISYGGRDFGDFDGLAAASVTISNQAVGGNHGWADATDADLGDSHRARAFRFSLDNPADVTLSVVANPTATSTSVGGLLPGFSVYEGLAHLAPAALDHDFSDASAAYLASLPGPPKEGAWNALDDFTIGNDEGALSTFAFVGYGVDGDAANFGTTPGIVGDGAADGSISKTFRLDAGSYSIFLGGADYASQLGWSATQPPFGLAVTLSVAPVPEPGTALLLLGGLGGLARMRGAAAGRRR
jgi:hypothetical protein